jgi:hypothetical protein
MLQQARAELDPAQRMSRHMVTAIETNCSTISIAANVPILLAAVKYPVITPHRQLTGIEYENNRIASKVRISPIQSLAINGADK